MVHHASRLRVRQVARDEVVRRPIGRISQRCGKRRHNLGADCMGERAAGAETTARRRVDRIGRIAGKRHFRVATVRVEHRLGGEQRARVGMPWPRVDFLDRAGFDHAAEIHHQHAITDILDDVQVMADEQIAEIEAFLRLYQQIEYLRLNRLVECRDSLIENDHPRRERAGDVHSLALAAGQFMRIAPRILPRVDSDLRQQSFRVLDRFPTGQAMHPRRVGDALRHGHAWVER